MNWDYVTTPGPGHVILLVIGLVICICRCCWLADAVDRWCSRRPIRMAQNVTAHALHEPLIVVEPEMPPGGEIQATATQVSPQDESPADDASSQAGARGRRCSLLSS